MSASTKGLTKHVTAAGTWYSETFLKFHVNYAWLDGQHRWQVIITDRETDEPQEIQIQDDHTGRINESLELLRPAVKRWVEQRTRPAVVL